MSDREALALTMLRTALETRRWLPVRRAYELLGGVATVPGGMALTPYSAPTTLHERVEAQGERQFFQRTVWRSTGQ